MRIGLIGAHRTGKTTLAKLLAAKLNIGLAPSGISKIAKEHAFDMDNDFRDNPLRFVMQQEIQRHLDHSALENFISDRTPIDAAAYQMCDMRANSGSPALQEAVLQYVDEAVRMTDANYDTVILIQPGLPFKQDDGKPGANLAYQEHHNLVCKGLMDDLSIPWGIIERDNLDLLDRAKAITNHLEDCGLV